MRTSSGTSRRTNPATRRVQGVARTARHYLNTTLSLFLAFIVSIGTTPVRGTYAYFTNTQQNTGNAFAAASLSAPTNVTAQLAGSSITVSWTPSTSDFANGYDVYSDTGAATWSTLAGSTAAGAVAFTHTPATTTATDYSYKVRAKAGSSGAWVSALSAASNTVSFTGIMPKLIPPYTPGAGSLGVSRSTSIGLTFSEPMNQTTTQAAISLWPCSSNNQDCVAVGTATGFSGYSWPTDRQVKASPSATLTSNQWYRAAVSGGSSASCTICAKDTNASSAQPDSMLQLDGVDDRVTVPNINLATTTFTIEAWAKRTTVDFNENDYVLSQGVEVQNQGLHFGGNQSDFLFAFYNDDLHCACAFSSDWHHWAGTFDSGTNARKLYRDGVLMASDTAAANFQGSGDLNIGDYFVTAGGDNPFLGNIDEVRVWNVVRTEAQIAQNAWSRLTGAEAGLVAYWRFDDGSGTVAADTAGSDDPGTLVGGASFTTAPGRVPPSDQTFVFRTGDTSDAVAPRAPVITAPSGDTQVSAAAYAIVGSLNDATYSSTVLADAPAGYWRLGESSGGTANYSSTTGTAGAYNGGVTLAQPGALADTDTAASFDGVDAYVSVATTGMGTVANTRELWFYASSFPLNTNNYLMDFGGNKWWMQVLEEGGTGRKLRVGVGTDGVTSSGVTPINAGTWYHVVASYDGTQLKVYLNGGLEIDQAASNGTAPDALNLGRHNSVTPGFYWQGQIDEVALYNTALSASQVLSHYQARFGSDANSLIKVYRDETPTDTFTTSTFTYLPQYTTQLNGGLTSFSIPVELSDGPNRFALTATDSQSQESAITQTSLISRTGLTTLPGLLTLAPAANTIAVTAPFTGDLDGDNSATVGWRTPPGGGSYTTAAMTRASNQLTYTIPTLTVDTQYEVQVTYADPDGLLMGGGATTQTAITTTSSALDIISVSHTPSSAPFASRAGQSLAITVNTNSASGRYVKAEVDTTPAKSLLGCTLITGNSSFGPLAWNGTNGALAEVADGTYTYTVSTWSDVGCATPIEKVTRQVTISNAYSVALDPAPASVTLSSNQYACVTATVRNASGGLVPDGVPVQFLYSVSGGNGTYRLTGATTGTDISTPSTTVTSNTGVASSAGTPAGTCAAPPSGSGKAVAKMGVNTASTNTNATITVKAQVSTQLTGTILTTVNNSTTINDPPDAPTGLVLTPGSIRVSFQPSPSLVSAGYFVHLGVSPGTYSRKIDIGNKTSVTIEDVIPGQRYWVTVQAYDKLGQTSAMSNEASLVAPPTAAAASIVLDATSRTPGAPLRLGAIVRARVLDASGRPVGGAPITLASGTSTRLESTTMITDVNGEAATGLTVDDQTLPQTRITASSGAATGSLDLTLLPQTPTPTASPTASPTATLLPTVTGTVIVETATPIGTPATTTVELTPTVAGSGTALAGTIVPTGTALIGAGSTATVTPASTVSDAAGTPTPTPPPAPSVPQTPATSATSAVSVSPGASGTAAAGSPSPTAETAATPTPPPPTATPAPGVSTAQSSAAAGASATSPPGTAAPPTPVPATSVPPTSIPPTTAPATAAPPTSVPPTSAPPTSVPPTSVPATSVPPTAVPPTSIPATSVPPTSIPR